MPVIWLIDAYRAGERGQVRALAQALGWPCAIKQLEYRQWAFLPHLLGRATLAGITAASRRQLRPPWPDLVISCGVRNEPVCRWIRRQSGGRSRYVHVGRPWGALDGFDAVITTPQYRVPGHPRVVHNLLTLHRVNRERLTAAGRQFASITEGLPAPHIAVIIGGNSGPYTFGPRAARRLAQEAGALAGELGGSLLLTTSSRTDPATIEPLQAALQVPYFLYQWRPGDEGNPYLGMLALADRLIVTADSIAMLSEACATGKPVAMFDLGGMRDGQRQECDFRLGGWLYRQLLRWFRQPLSRDIRLVHKALDERGYAYWLGAGSVAESRHPPVTGTAMAPDLQRAVTAVERLLAERPVVDVVE